jgi:hypothetical protein
MNDTDADRMGNVWRLDPGDRHKFQKARMGDHLMVSFECDLCVFRKLFGRNPMDREQDERAVATIRRMILDAFWS